MNITWDNLCSGLIGSMMGAAISWVLYYKQRNDQLVEMLHVKFSEQFTVIAKIKQADLYTKNSINGVDYSYNCSLLEELDNMCKYLDLLMDVDDLKNQIITNIKQFKITLTNVLDLWRSHFKMEHFTTRKNTLAMCSSEVASNTLAMFLAQDLYSLQLILKGKEKEFIKMEEKFISLAKMYIIKKKWCI